jgi:hypothetical protein
MLIVYIDPSEFDKIQWTVYALGTTLNSLMLLNIIICVFFGTYLVVLERREVANCQALAFMSLEAERNMLWKRKSNKRLYLQMCKTGKVEDDTDPVIGKIKDVKVNLKEIREEMEEFYEIKNDIKKLLEINGKMAKRLPRERKTGKEKEKNAIILLILLMKSVGIEEGNEKSKAAKKIQRYMSRLY